MRPGLPDRRTAARDRRRPGRPSPAGSPGGFAVPLLRCRLPADLQHQGRQAAFRRRPRRAVEPQTALRQRPVRVRLHSSSAPADQTADPEGRRRQRPGHPARPRQPAGIFPRSDMGRGTRPRGIRAEESDRRTWRQRACRVRFRQGIERGSLSVPETGPHRLSHQQCRSLYPPVSRIIGRRVDGNRQFRGRVGTVLRLRKCRRHRRHRRKPDRQSPCRRDILQECRKNGATLIVMDPRGQALSDTPRTCCSSRAAATSPFSTP